MYYAENSTLIDFCRPDELLVYYLKSNFFSPVQKQLYQRGMVPMKPTDDESVFYIVWVLTPKIFDLNSPR